MSRDVYSHSRSVGARQPFALIRKVIAEAIFNPEEEDEEPEPEPEPPWARRINDRHWFVPAGGRPAREGY